jgi:hypothetical protein
MNTSNLCQLALILQASSSALESPARKALDKNSQSDFFWLLISTAFVAVGIAFEYPEVKHEFMEWLRSRQKPWVVDPVPTTRNKVPLWSLIGFIIVTAGVAGEGVYEGLLGINDTKIRKMDEASIVASESETAQLRVRAEELEEQILDQGPRDLLLYGKREENFTNSIRQFNGQKVQVRRCEFNNNEARDTAERLTVFFKNAEWIVSPNSPDWGESNCLFVGPNEPIPTGIWVGTPNSRPTPRTQERAKELARLLGQIPLAATLHFVRIETARSGPSRENIVEEYGDPDSIVVTILGHPSEAVTRNPTSISPFAIGP